jgi:glycosyltransferase involved in cell wall biosynthesis
VGIRVAIVDDNPHVAWEGRVYPVNATFQHFAAGVLDIPGSSVASITSCVPVRDATATPGRLPLDPRIRVVRTAPFDGIAGYLRHLPSMLRANRQGLARAIAEADLVWLKVPASNAALVGALSARAGVARFVWVAGSAADVAAGRYRGPGGLAAGAVGAGYDLVGRAVGLGGRRIVVGAGVVDGDGVVSSLVEPAELRDPDVRAWPPEGGSGRLAWAGRLAAGKGLEALITAVAGDATLTLDILGDGPDRERLQALADTSGAGRRVRWAGHLADRVTYMDRLASADAFVFPSPAEGFPKVVLDAFAVGLPVVATRAGALVELADARLITPIEQADAASVLTAWNRLLGADPAAISERRRRAHDFAAEHTRPAEAARLVARWRGWWPDLPWDRPSR